MIKKYEDACKKAGLSEDRIREIRKLFDADKKRSKRQRRSKKKNRLWMVSLSEMLETANDSEWDIPDMTADAEEIAIQKCLSEQLEYELSLLDAGDREFILACYDPAVSVREYARRINVPFRTIIDRRDRILTLLRKRIGVNENYLCQLKRIKVSASESICLEKSGSEQAGSTDECSGTEFKNTKGAKSHE